MTATIYTFQQTGGLYLGGNNQMKLTKLLEKEQRWKNAKRRGHYRLS